jgi:uncharacterized protein YggU (UPF0235/DUF167 family)
MIQSVGSGIVIEVRVIPRAGRSELAGVRGDSLLVRLEAAPVDGAANAALTGLLAAALGVPKRAVTIVAENARDRNACASSASTPRRPRRVSRGPPAR